MEQDICFYQYQVNHVDHLTFHKISEVYQDIYLKHDQIHLVFVEMYFFYKSKIGYAKISYL